MHSAPAIRMVDALGRGGILFIAASGLAAFAGIPPAITPLVADIGLGSFGVSALATAAWAWSVRLRVRALPLELGPQMARGWVDGVPVYRIRARLGHGRALRDPVADVRWQGTSGATALAAVVPATHLCGPFTVLVQDPQRQVSGDGAFHVTLRVRSGGQSWDADHTYTPDDVKDGRFGGLQLAKRGVQFATGWSDVIPAPAETDPS